MKVFYQNQMGRETEIDDSTALWAARMIIGEGGRNCSWDKAAAILWAITNRWMLHPARRHWPTLQYLMRRFSQPINPRWQRGGDLARKYASTKYCTPARLRRRAQVSGMRWKDMPERVMMVVLMWREGDLAPPAAVLALDHPRISNWASHKGLSKKYPWGVALSKSKQPDWFFEDAKLAKGNVVVVGDYYD